MITQSVQSYNTALPVVSQSITTQAAVSQHWKSRATPTSLQIQQEDDNLDPIMTSQVLDSVHSVGDHIARNGISTSIQVNEEFFVPAHPVFMVLIPYGLFLTFTSFLCPLCLLPLAPLPLAPLATFLGLKFNSLMGILSFVAASLHIGEAIQAFEIANVYGLSLTSTLLWTANTLAFGIFGMWPLAFVDFFYSVSDTYCQFPGSSCFNV